MTNEEIIEFCEMKAELEPENEDIYEAIIKTLEQTRWIPVGERLPEDKQRVFITRKSGTIGYIMWNMWWHEQKRYPADKAIAWMPLPQPYKAESEGTKE